MSRISKVLAAPLVLILLGLTAGAAHAEKRIALVIGNAEYQLGALKTPANDAGLIAQTLQASGFDVVGARDLDQDALRGAFRDFIDKASASGPSTTAFIYISGYGLQLEGENYFVPIDAKMARDTDVPAEAVRLSAYIRPLAALRLNASIVVLDAARVNPFASAGQPLAGGLALVEPEPSMLIAFNAAPGTVTREGRGPYGPYAQALAEMMREGGLPLADVFQRTRLRVNEVTKGAEVPWHASRLQAPVVFLERAPDAPSPAVSPEQAASIHSRSIRDLDAQQAYLEALNRDRLQGYLDFLTAYPDDPMAKRVLAIVAARREAIIWRQARFIDTPEAYWSYLRLYARGPHAPDARRRLAYHAAAIEPPPSFQLFDYEVPPTPDEIVYVDRPVLIFDDPEFAFPPPPPPPPIFLPPPPPDFIFLPPPPPPVDVFVLPIPVYVPVPIWCQPPAYLDPPSNNVIFANIHNKVEVSDTTNIVKITDRAGQITTLPAQASPGTAGRLGASPDAPVIGPALPPSLAHNAIPMRKQAAPVGDVQPSSSAHQFPTQPGHSTQPPLGEPSPGASGQPLSPAAGAPEAGSPQTSQPAQPQPQPQQNIQQRRPSPPSRMATKRPPAPAVRRPPASPPAVTRPTAPPPAVRRPPGPHAVVTTPPSAVVRSPPPRMVTQRPPSPRQGRAADCGGKPCPR